MSFNMSSSRAYLESIKKIGSLVGDFYLLLGREWIVEKNGGVNLGTSKECYKNAFNLAQWNLELVYCEGYA